MEGGFKGDLEGDLLKSLELDRKEEGLYSLSYLKVYPFTSFMAEVGGALGLFLGLSFLSFWDMFVDATNWCIGRKMTF